MLGLRDALLGETDAIRASRPRSAPRPTLLTFVDIESIDSPTRHSSRRVNSVQAVRVGRCMLRHSAESATPAGALAPGMTRFSCGRRKTTGQPGAVARPEAGPEWRCTARGPFGTRHPCHPCLCGHYRTGRPSIRVHRERGFEPTRSAVVRCHLRLGQYGHTRSCQRTIRTPRNLPAPSDRILATTTSAERRD